MSVRDKFKKGDRVVHKYTEVEYTVLEDSDDWRIPCRVDSVPTVLQDIMTQGEKYNVCVDQLISAGEYHEDDNINSIPVPYVGDCDHSKC